MISLKRSPLTLTNHLTLLTWQETEKEYYFQRYFVFHENVTPTAQMNLVSLSHIIELCILMYHHFKFSQLVKPVSDRSHQVNTEE